jgi:hypothetical protein
MATAAEKAATESDESSDSESSSSDSSVGSGQPEHDHRMEALDHWRIQSLAWVNAQDTPLLERHSLPPIARTTDVPLELRANDIKRHIINIDSQFRDDPLGSTSSNFYFSLLEPVRNVMRVRITSIEFPNNYAFFTPLRKNVTLRFYYGVSFGTSLVLTIEKGNYNAGDMEVALNAALTTAGLPWLTTLFNPITGKFTFTGTGAGSSAFKMDTTCNSHNQPFAYGLGYYIGFSYGVLPSTTVSPYTLTSEFCAHFAGDNYVFLKVNDYECVRQTMGDNDFVALAKIVLREPKDHMAFDDYASQHIKEVVFPNPVDLIRFKIEIVDPYGRSVDMCAANMSFSLEVLEVKNRSLYDTVRESIMMRYI